MTQPPAAGRPARRRLEIGRLGVGRLGVGRLGVGRLGVGRLGIGRLGVIGLGPDLVLAALLALVTAPVLGSAAGRGATSWLLAGVVLVVLAVLALRVVRVVRADPEGRSPLGETTLLRSATVLVVLCGWVVPGDLVWAGAAALVLTLAVAAEAFLLRLLRLPVAFVHGLPGVTNPPPPSRLVPAVGAASAAVTLLGAVLAAVGAPGWTWTLLAVVSLVPAAVVVAQTRSRRRAGAAASGRVVAALTDYAPEFVLFTARPDDASYQLTMWLPYLRRTGRRFVVLTRAVLPAERLASSTALEGVPVVCCRTLTELEAALVPSVRAVFYVNASSGNGALTRYGHLEHVYLGHGDSDKPPSYNPTHAMFDLVFAAGPAAVRRYAEHGVRIAADKFRVVGRPQVEAVAPARRPASAADPVVLYAPTWRGHVSETALSSLDRGERIVAALLERGATVVFRPHPFSYDFADDAATVARIQRLLATDADATGRAHLWGAAAETDRSAFDCMNASDAMVSDVSSVVSDYLFSGKPYAMVAPTGPAGADLDGFAADYPVGRAAYLVDAELDALPAALDAILGPDPLAEHRAALRVDYLGPAAADPARGAAYAQTFVDAVLEVLNHPGDHDHEVAESEDGTVRIGRDTVRRHLVAIVRTAVGLVLGTGALTAALARLATGPGDGSEVPLLVTSAVSSVLVVGLVLAELLLRLRSARTPDPAGLERASTRLTVLDAPRVAVLLGLAAVVVGTGPVAGTGTAVVVAGLLLVLSVPVIAAETAVVDLLEAPGVRAVGLPELLVPEIGAARQLSGPLAGTGALALAGLLVLVLPAALVPLALLPVLPATVVGLLLATAAARRARQAASAEQRLPSVLAGRASRFCVYFGAGVGARYQLGMWLPWFDAIGEPYLVVCREPAVLAEIGAMLAARGPSAPDVPVLLRETFGSLETVITPSMTTAFYVNNAVRNTHLIERRELTHVWLNHGDSEKPACYNPVHAIYDLIFAAGQAGIDRYARHGVEIPAEKFVVVGRPQVSVIERGGSCTDAGSGSDTGIDAGRRTVLYAPTWQGPYADSRLFSLPQGHRIVQALLDRDATVVFRPHPFNRRFPESRALVDELGAVLAADAAASGRPHRWGPAAEDDWSVEDCFNASDAMISDVSAVVSDYLQSGKPFSVVAVGRTPERLLAEAPAAAAAYLLDEGLNDLGPVLDGLLGHPFGADPLASARDEARRYHLGDFGFGPVYAEAFLDAARAVIGGRLPVGEAR